MHIETERKFLVRGTGYKAAATRHIRMEQGYLARGGGNTVRVRIAEDKAFLTIKGPSPDGISRFEWEKEIPVRDAEELLRLCPDIPVRKTRWLVPAGDGHLFEVDEFLAENEGLTVAEIELAGPDEEFPKPEWLGEEVTGDRRYYNAQLAVKPYKDWK